MNTTERSPEDKAALADFFATVKDSETGRAPYVQDAPEAMRRLAKAVYGHDNSQAQTVVACLASIYNGPESPRIRLDEIRWLDWSLQKDLVAVMIAAGQKTFPDTAIRQAFHDLGGDEAAEWFHRHLIYVHNFEDVLADPAASNWLKDALRKALDRDAVDAANDAEILAEILKKRIP